MTAKEVVSKISKSYTKVKGKPVGNRFLTTDHGERAKVHLGNSY